MGQEIEAMSVKVYAEQWDKYWEQALAPALGEEWSDIRALLDEHLVAVVADIMAQMVAV